MGKKRKLEVREIQKIVAIHIKFTQVTQILTTAVSEMLDKRLSSKFILCCRIMISLKKNKLVLRWKLLTSVIQVHVVNLGKFYVY
jgi:hypothetical protein